jgi:hypothetical protein
LEELDMLDMKRSTIGAALMGMLLTSAAGCSKQTECKTSVVTISGNHGHVVAIPAKHGAGTYAVRGGDHEHTLALSAAEFAELSAAGALRTRTTSVKRMCTTEPVKRLFAGAAQARAKITERFLS